MHSRSNHFGLVIQEKNTTDKQPKFDMTAKNQGIPLPEIILRVRALLEELENNFRDKAKSNLTFCDLDDERL